VRLVRRDRRNGTVGVQVSEREVALVDRGDVGVGVRYGCRVGDGLSVLVMVIIAGFAAGGETRLARRCSRRRSCSGWARAAAQQASLPRG